MEGICDFSFFVGTKMCTRLFELPTGHVHTSFGLPSGQIQIYKQLGSVVAVINECRVAPCQNGGACLALLNGHLCLCGDGFAGANCETGTNDLETIYCGLLMSIKLRLPYWYD